MLLNNLLAFYRSQGLFFVVFFVDFVFIAHPFHATGLVQRFLGVNCVPQLSGHEISVPFSFFVVNACCFRCLVSLVKSHKTYVLSTSRVASYPAGPCLFPLKGSCIQFESRFSITYTLKSLFRTYDSFVNSFMTEVPVI